MAPAVGAIFLVSASRHRSNRKSLGVVPESTAFRAEMLYQDAFEGIRGYRAPGDRFTGGGCDAAHQTSPRLLYSQMIMLFVPLHTPLDRGVCKMASRPLAWSM